jgi:hypothetical protein
MARPITMSEWGRIIANAWIDSAFAQELSTDPAEAARSFLKLDAETEILVFEIPPKPADLSNQQIEEIRNGRVDSFHLPGSVFFSC